MEEQVGRWWHRLVTNIAEQRYPNETVELDSIRKELGVIFRAFGGIHGLEIDAVAEKSIKRSGFMRWIAGSQARVQLASFDDQGLRLPSYVNAYPDKSLNYELYLWWASLGAVLYPFRGNDFHINQKGTVRLINNYPGLAAIYRRLVQAEIARRGDIQRYSQRMQESEIAIRTALEHPGKIKSLHTLYQEHQPSLLWLAQEGGIIRSASFSDGDSQSLAAPTVQKDNKRRKSESPEGPARKGGLLIFRPESIFSWTEYAKVEHEFQENDDEDLSKAADDLETLSIGNDPWSISKKLQMKLDPREYVETEMSVSGNLQRLPEWNYKTELLISDHCIVNLIPQVESCGCELPESLHAESQKMKKLFSSFVTDRQTERGQTDGSDIDLDACIRARSCLSRDEISLYKSTRRKNRDLSCLLLADLSLSTDAALNNTVRVIDVLRQSLVLFAETLSATHDRLAIYGFNSRGRKSVRISEIKKFNERYDANIRERILCLQPAYYTRMGAAIRYACMSLEREHSRERVLILLTDGKPNDNDYYEGRYGIEDTRHALISARRQGFIPFCVTIDQEAESYLPHIFGQHSYVIVKRAQDLPYRLTRLYAQLTQST